MFTDCDEASLLFLVCAVKAFTHYNTLSSTSAVLSVCSFVTHLGKKAVRPPRMTDGGYKGSASGDRASPYKGFDSLHPHPAL